MLIPEWMYWKFVLFLFINLFASALLCGENCSCTTSGYTMEESQQVSCLVYNNVYCFIPYLLMY